MYFGKLKKIPKTTKIFDIKKIEKSGESIYAVILRLSKRSYEINKLIKDEISQKMEKFYSYKETVGISKLFEELPHPTVIATQEFSDLAGDRTQDPYIKSVKLYQTELPSQNI
jgi:hypothetical protein